MVANPRCKKYYLIWTFVCLALYGTSLIMSEWEHADGQIVKRSFNFDFFDFFEIIRRFFLSLLHSFLSIFRTSSSSPHCNDFYHSVCGKLGPPQDLKSLTMTKVFLNIILALNTSEKNNDPESFRVIRSYYKVCMDKDLTKRTWKENLREILVNVGGWPVLNTWNEAKFELTTTLIKLRENGLFYQTFVPYKPQALLEPKNAFFITLKKPEIEDNFVLLINDTFKVAIALGANETQAQSQMQSVINFQKKLKELSDFKENETKTFTLQKLINEFSYLNWHSYFDVEMQGSDVLHFFKKGFSMENSHYYYKNLEGLIRNTPKVDVANYLVLRGIQPLIEKIAPIIDELDLELLKPPMKYLIYKCLEEINSFFPMLYQAVYIRNYIEKDAIVSIQDIFRNLRTRFIKEINNFAWMDSKNIAKAIHTIKSIKFDLDFTEYWDKKFLDNIFNRIQPFKSKTYLHAIISTQKFLADINITMIPYEEPWKSIRFFGNSRYYFDNKKIVLNIGDAVPVVYDYRWEKHLQYSRVGYILAHEMSHSILLTDAYLKEVGKEHYWYSNWTKAQFDNRSKCIVDHYNKYEVDGIHLNGTTSLDENLADILGLKVAYLTYKDLVKENTNEAGSTYTLDEKFFINFAEYYCQSFDFIDLKEVLQSLHGLFKFRVQGSVSNLNEFSTAFNCPENSQMNPANKCPMFL